MLMEKHVSEVHQLFERVKNELFNPSIFIGEVKVREKTDKVSFSIKGGLLNITLGEKFLQEGEWENVLIWLFRHYLSHIHYCPYDLRTAYELERAAFQILRNRELAHISLRFFAELMVDLIYLPYRFLEVPGHLEYIFRRAPKGLEQLLYSTYKIFYEDHIPDYEVDHLVEGYARDIFLVARSSKPWLHKQKLIASIIGRLIALRGNMKSKPGKLKERFKERFPGFIPLSEDLRKIGEREVSQVYGEIRDRDEAKAFYNNWLKPRLRDEEKRIKEVFEREVLAKVKGEKKRGRGYKKKAVEKREVYRGEEPSLPTSLSSPLSKLKRKAFEEALWRRYWYKARAQKILLEYALQSRIKRVSFKEETYPEEWRVEDDVEELDIELTISEGPFIPEVTTAKWAPKRLEVGSILIPSPAPSLVIVLDSSKSMLSSFDNAATSAFILYLSAKHAGSKVSVVNFSTNFIYADWNTDDTAKEIVLSLPMGKYTVFPYPKIEEIMRESPSEPFLMIITDGGWQNFGETLQWLIRIRKEGFKVLIFHLYGWKYDQNIKLLKEKARVNVIRVDRPEVDLNRITLTEAGKRYGPSFYPSWV